MIISEPAFDRRLIKPFLAYGDVFAVTGRTAHNDSIGWQLRRHHVPFIGLPLRRILFTNHIRRENPCGRNIFGIRDVVNRGPLALNHTRAETLGYFDESFAPYTWDDHDLCLRAFSIYGWLCGSYPVEYQSDDAWGTTRQKNSNIYAEANARNERQVLQRHMRLLSESKHDEDRFLQE
jgi:hypothetical protein